MSRAVAFFLAGFFAVFSCGVASAQLKAPQKLLFAEISADMKSSVEQLYVSPKAAGQVAAVEKLVAMGAAVEPAIPFILPILNEKIDDSVRRAVVAMLIKLGKPVLEPVRPLLNSQRMETRINAIEILEAVPDKDSVDPLTNLVLHDASALIRERALDAVARLAMTNPAVGVKLLATVQDEKAQPEIRSRAMKAMGRLAGGTLSVQVLVAMLENAEADIRLRCAAAAALGQSRKAEAVAPLVKALGDKKTPIRVWAAVALNGNSSSEAISALTKALGDEDERVRVRAADALAAVQDPKVVEPLAKAVGDASAEVRTWAAIGLGNFTDKKALDALATAVRDNDVQVRVAAADSLGRTGAPQAAPYLMDRLNDFGEDVEVRVAAARALGALRDSRAVPTLLGLMSENDKKVRQWVVSTLGRIGDARAVEPLIKALDDRDPAVRGWAALALGRFRDPRIIEPLLKAAKDSDAQVRAHAVLALRVAVNDARVKAALQAAATDSDATVQEKAKQVLASAGS